jgi:Ni,Fe-hydrogenase III large subunit/Ni,Fe-hydrogenase III component G
MAYKDVLKGIEIKHNLPPFVIADERGDEIHVTVKLTDFSRVCRALHKELKSPVMMLFAVDERATHCRFGLFCVFEGAADGIWLLVKTDIPETEPSFESLSKDIYSASLFEREIKEMFGIEPNGNPDQRSLRLHDEVWPRGVYPLRKGFNPGAVRIPDTAEYRFTRIQGDGVFEIPVGPVHAGIIGPGHFRFSVAGEPVINLELRLGFTHRGVEKLIESRTASGALPLVERVSGDSVVAHSVAFVTALEKICGRDVPKKAKYLRAIVLELERMYNHSAGIGGIALDVGFSFPSAFASLTKEKLLAVNEHLTGSRYLKGFIRVGGVAKDFTDADRGVLLESLGIVQDDFRELKEMLFASASFMDRVDGTGVLKKNVAEDLGVTGLAARASGIALDLRKDFPGVYDDARFAVTKQVEGDVLARLKMRIEEFEESIRLVREFVRLLEDGDVCCGVETYPRAGHALGYAEGWRGPVLYWVATGENGRIERCKIVDPSFRNWEGLALSVPGNIIPDFPLCNKSFDLSYSGNDL